MLDSVTDSSAEGKQDDHANHPKGGSKDNVTNRPSVFERPQNEDQLRNDVHGNANDGPDDVDDPEGDGLGIGESGYAFKSRNAEEEAECKEDEAGNAEEPEGQRGAIFRKLEANEAVDKNAAISSSQKAGINGCKPLRQSKGQLSKMRKWVLSYRIGTVGSGDNAGVEEHGKQLYHHVYPEECNDLFPSNGGVFASDMIDHDSGHDNGDNVNKQGGLRQDVSQRLTKNHCGRDAPGWKSSVPPTSTFLL